MEIEGKVIIIEERECSYFYGIEVKKPDAMHKLNGADFDLSIPCGLSANDINKVKDGKIPKEKHKWDKEDLKIAKEQIELWEKEKKDYENFLNFPKRCGLGRIILKTWGEWELK